MNRRQILTAKTVLLGGFLMASPAFTADLVKPQPKKKIKVPSVRIAHQHRLTLANGETMTTPRVIDRANKNPGVILGDTLDFTAVLMSANVSLESSRYTWSGAAAGQGNQIAATFNAVGASALTLSIFDKNSNRNKSFTAETRIRSIPPEQELHVCNPFFADTQTMAYCDEALVFTTPNANSWASDPNTAERLGLGHVSCTLDDGKCNAAKHSYWNLLLRRDTSEAFAIRLTNAHERLSVEGTGIDAGGAHNASVMDLDNNAMGREIYTELFQPITDAAAQTAIVNAVKSPRLTKLDTAAHGATLSPPDTNPQGSGLLEPTNQ